MSHVCRPPSSRLAPPEAGQNDAATSEAELKRPVRLGISRRSLASLLALVVVSLAASAQERGPTTVSATELRQAIDHLGDLDYKTRATAGRTVRRSPAAQAVPALLQAVSGHSDGYVRFRALILLTGFNDPRTADTMKEAMASPNDRLREVAYGYFELHPDPALTPRLLAAFEKEQGEFVRPSLLRAMAALATDAKVTEALIRDATRGEDYFRSTVIEALGDYKVAAAVSRLVEVARLDGPLQDDAVTALGKIGDPAAMVTLAQLQRTAPAEAQPAIAAAICLLGTNCQSHIGYLEKTLRYAADYPGYQELLRGSASGLGAISLRGNLDTLNFLFDLGIPSQDPVRAPVTLALGLVALRNMPLMVKALEARSDKDEAIGILAEAFDMLEEDLEEERFFASIRRAYWSADDGSATRRLCEQIISKLDF
jgi:HEAT repeat protein